MSNNTTKMKNRSLILLILSLIAGMVFLTPLLRFTYYDQMLSALKITDIQLGTIGSVYGILNVLCYPFSGILADKFSTKKLLLISCAGMCLTTVWYSFLPGFGALIAIHALYGVFSVGTFWSPYLKAVRQLGSDEEQGRLFGMSEGLRGIGQTVIAAICLSLIVRFSSVEAGFRSLLIVNAIVFAVLFIAVFFFIPDVKEEKKEEKENTDKEERKDNTFVKTLTSSSTWICIFVIACGYCLWHTANGFIGTYCTRVLNLSPEISSVVSIIRSYIIVFAAGITGGFIIDRFKTKGKGMFWIFLLTGISCLGIMLTGKVALLCLAITLVLSYFINVIKSTYWSIMGDAGIPVESTGLATGIISFIALTPEIFVPPVVSRFITYGENIGNVAAGFQLMFLWILVWSVLGVVASLILKRRKEKMSV